MDEVSHESQNQPFTTKFLPDIFSKQLASKTKEFFRGKKHRKLKLTFFGKRNTYILTYNELSMCTYFCAECIDNLSEYHPKLQWLSLTIELRNIRLCPEIPFFFIKRKGQKKNQ